MRAYLTEFLNRFSYAPSDAAVLSEAYERIVADPKAKAAFEKAEACYRSSSSCDHAQLIRLADIAASGIALHEYTAELLLYIVLSKALHERYLAAGLDEQIFYDSMCDLRYKLEECKAVKGIVGSFVAGWFAGFFEMTRFAFGRLQFELVPFEATFEQDGFSLGETDRVINVHIPRDGTPLEALRCEQAYERAAAFFRPTVGDKAAFVCYSWLLDPALQSVLPSHSNILRFASRYTLLRSGVHKESPDLWRLFDTDERHPDRLPQNTTARRLVAAHLKAGGKLGWGYGVFVWNN